MSNKTNQSTKIKKHFKKPARGHKSYESAYNGICKYIERIRCDLFVDCKDCNQGFSKVGSIVRVFLTIKNIEHRKGKRYEDVVFNCNLAQEYFNEFKVFIQNYSKWN